MILMRVAKEILESISHCKFGQSEVRNYQGCGHEYRIRQDGVEARSRPGSQDVGNGLKAVLQRFCEHFTFRSSPTTAVG